MYVQFQIPAKARGWPVIMVHGSSHTGACLESTPDGREGWYPYFVRHGVATYVVDQAGRGRSGFDQSVLHDAESKLLGGDTAGAADRIPGFGRITDNAAWTNWFGHLVPADSTVLTGRLIPHGDADDPNPNPEASRTYSLFPSTPSIESGRPPGGSVRTAGAGAAYALSTQTARPSRGALHGSVCDTATQGVATLRHGARIRRSSKAGRSRDATHSQSGIMGHHMLRLLKERGQANLLKGLITLEGSCSLSGSGLTAADFDNIPYLAVKGDYANVSPACSETVAAINARRAEKLGTAKAEYLKLDEIGMLGVTHMMMLDKNNLKIADILLEWVKKNVRN